MGPGGSRRAGRAGARTPAGHARHLRVASPAIVPGAVGRGGGDPVARARSRVMRLGTSRRRTRGLRGGSGGASGRSSIASRSASIERRPPSPARTSGNETRKLFGMGDACLSGSTGRYRARSRRSPAPGEDRPAARPWTDRHGGAPGMSPVFGVGGARVRARPCRARPPGTGRAAWEVTTRPPRRRLCVGQRERR